MRSTHTTDAAQLELFRQAVQLLGGQHATARYLGMNERQIRFLVKGERPLHDGFLRDISAALIRHADACKAMERRLSPAFAANLTVEQEARMGKPDARRFDSPALSPSSSEAVGGSSQ